MSSASDLILAPMVRKLEHWHPLNEKSGAPSLRCLTLSAS